MMKYYTDALKYSGFTGTKNISISGAEKLDWIFIKKKKTSCVEKEQG